MFEEVMQARLPKVCQTQGEMQHGGRAEKKERNGGRKRKRKGDKGKENKTSRGIGEQGRRKNRDFEEDSGGVGGCAGSAAGDCGGTTEN